jgi:hypothetical protein
LFFKENTAGFRENRASRGQRMDRREDQRFNLSVPVQFDWTMQGALLHSGEGRTLNASLRGVFVVTDVCPPLGSALRLNLVLPSSAGGSALLMRAKATVVRVEAINGAGTGTGFAAATKRYILEKRQGSEGTNGSS